MLPSELPLPGKRLKAGAAAGADGVGVLGVDETLGVAVGVVEALGVVVSDDTAEGVVVTSPTGVDSGVEVSEGVSGVISEGVATPEVADDKTMEFSLVSLLIQYSIDC